MAEYLEDSKPSRMLGTEMMIEFYFICFSLQFWGRLNLVTFIKYSLKSKYEIVQLFREDVNATCDHFEG